jgi:hypothetical protein
VLVAAIVVGATQDRRSGILLASLPGSSRARRSSTVLPCSSQTTARSCSRRSDMRWRDDTGRPGLGEALRDGCTAFPCGAGWLQKPSLWARRIHPAILLPVRCPTTGRDGKRTGEFRKPTERPSGISQRCQMPGLGGLAMKTGNRSTTRESPKIIGSPNANVIRRAGSPA